MAKRILITGGCSGIGKETAKALVDAGHQVIIACRNMDQGRKLKDQWTEDNPDQVCVMYVDLNSVESILAFVNLFNKKFAYLDVLIHNAGIFLDEKRINKDGLDEVMMVNYLAPMILSKKLKEALVLGEQPSILHLVSKAGFQGKLSLTPNYFSKARKGFKAYADSKLALMMAVYHEQLADIDHEISRVAIHPGVVKTKIFEGKTLGMKLVSKIMGLFSTTPVKGCETVVFLAQTENIQKYAGALVEKKYYIYPWPEKVKDQDQYKNLKSLTEDVFINFEI